jgi:imidazolonepropionase-like amidohydrolase
MKKLILLFLLVSFLFSTQLFAQGENSSAIAFEHVNVIPMNRNIVLKNQTVVIKAGRIVEVKPAQKIKLSENAVRIDGAGKYLLPGLADMHIHDYAGKLEDDFYLYLANGITLVRNMSGSPDGIKIREKVKRGELLAPHYFTAGPMIQTAPLDIPNQDSFPEETRQLIKRVKDHMAPRIVTLKAEKDIEAIIQEHKKLKYDFVKIHDDFPQDLYLKLLKEAGQAGIPVIGHAQRKLPLEYSTRLKSISHIEEFLHLFSEKELADTSNYPELGKRVAKYKITVAPTLLTFDMIHRYSEKQKFDLLLKDENLKYIPTFYRSIWASDLQPYRSRQWFGTPEGQRTILRQLEILKGLTKAMNDAGVPLILGTDVFGFVTPGFSIHRELELLVEAGLSPYQALRTATWNIGIYLGKENYSGGSIEKGKMADLVLLNKNPLENIQNTKSIKGVMIQGKWLDRKELDRMLLSVEQKYKK